MKNGLRSTLIHNTYVLFQLYNLSSIYSNFSPFNRDDKNVHDSDRNEDIIITNNTHVSLLPLLLVMVSLSLVVVLVMFLQRHWHCVPGTDVNNHQYTSEPIIQVIAARTHTPRTILTNIRSVSFF